ncbi:sigma-54-dependent transcriptional regulator [Thermodesulfatator atlanticus]|uniref:sigma-54-dependent transcriptional regulator n=1 Tax=Thermodesulfatator atlanticus TaxID=501497 RepID=UPI0003B41F99|nr:sigma-54 dependent transcriptional regulator [Thermodesulfatator atlanticus]
MNEKILVIDDEESILASLADILEDEGYQVITAKTAQNGLEEIKKDTPDLLILDVWLPDLDGLKLLKSLRKDYPELPVIVISGHGTVETAVRAIKLGAFDFLEKPLSYDRVVVTVANALKFRALKQEYISLKKSLSGPRITGKSQAIRQLQEALEKVAQTDATVLITGESGVGKEVAARTVHALSRRKDGPFVAVNCAAIPEELIESELFGHERGAFTGALSAKKGKFDLANGGTIFLDEIGDMSLSAQAKVLRVLQEKCFERVGGTRTINVDVRVIAATNKDLKKEIAAGKFREDLYYRLNVVPIHIPPLRERPEDIPLLVEEFLEEFAKHSGLGRKKISEEALAALKQYHWPGNIRELRNLIERLVIMSRGNIITLDDLPQEFQRPSQTPPPEEPWFKCDDFKTARHLFEREFLRRKLAEYNGNISQTAEAIGLERSYLHRKLKSLGLAGEN